METSDLTDDGGRGKLHTETTRFNGSWQTASGQKRIIEHHTFRCDDHFNRLVTLGGLISVQRGLLNAARLLSELEVLINDSSDLKFKLTHELEKKSRAESLLD